VFREKILFYVKMTSVMKILEPLPETMSLKDAIDEAKRLRREEELAKDRVRSEAYRQTHMEQKRARDRAYYARKKERQKSKTPGGSGSENIQETGK